MNPVKSAEFFYLPLTPMCSTQQLLYITTSENVKPIVFEIFFHFREILRVEDCLFPDYVLCGMA